MNDLQNWLLNKIPNLVPLRYPGVEIGTKRLSVRFDSQKSRVYPLNLNINSLINYSYTEVLLSFKIPGNQPILQFAKRLKFTPFYISSLYNEKYDLFIIDFFEWKPFTTLYRILTFQSLEEDIILEVNLPSQLSKKNRKKFSTPSWCLSYSEHGKSEVEDDLLKFHFSKTDKNDLNLVFRLSEKESIEKKDSISQLLKTCNQLESRARDGHILQDVKIQNIEKREMIDEMWHRQMGLNPDRQLNSVDAIPDIWTGKLCEYMDWPLSKKKRQQKYALTKQSKFANFCYKAYFEDTYTEREVVESVQKWWDQYSLPLYRMKLSELIVSDPALMFIIYLLSVEYNLPCAAYLLEACDSFYRHPQLALFALLFQSIVIESKKDDTIKYIPGSELDGNVSSVKRGEVQIKYSRFGKRHFTSLQINNRQVLKIDKKVTVSLASKQDYLKISPSLRPSESTHFRLNPVSLHINRLHADIPLIWKKAEITIDGCRIRWIFKKDRFQLTCQAINTDVSLKFDNIDAKLKKSAPTKFYYPIKKMENIANFRVYDDHGRSYLLHQIRLKQKIYLFGWMQDRSGILVQNFSISLDNHQKYVEVNESGLLASWLEVSKDLEHFDIKSRKMCNRLSLKKVLDKSNLTLMTYQPSGQKAMFVVMGDGPGIEKGEIRELFYENFGFVPMIINKSNLRKRHFNGPVIWIGKSDNLPDSFKKIVNSGSPSFILNNPKEIPQLFNLLSEYQ